MEVLNFENVPAVLAHCLSLINAKFQTYNKAGLTAYTNIFRLFQDVITFKRLLLEDNANKECIG